MEHSYETQAKIPWAVAAIHNFIILHDPAAMAREFVDTEENPARAARRFAELAKATDAPGGHARADTDDEQDDSDDDDEDEARRPPGDPQSKRAIREMVKLRDRLATEMWDSYQAEVKRRGDKAMQAKHMQELLGLLPLERRKKKRRGP